LLVVLAFTVVAAAPRPVESTHLKIIVGVTDDTAKWMGRQDGIVGVHRDLRLMAVRVTGPWKPGQVQPTKLQQVYLHRIARMIQLNDRIVLAVYNVARYAPTVARDRNQYCAFLRGVVRGLPLIHDMEIWNEANSPAYWPQEAGAAAYGALLARLRRPAQPPRTDERHQLDSLTPRSGRVRLRPRRCVQLEHANAPALRHVRTQPVPGELCGATVDPARRFGPDCRGDYETLMNVLRTSFEGTPQPLPGTRGVSIWYVEDGFQTMAPPDKRRYYRGRENDVHAVPALAPRGETTVVDQATQLRDAILLAYCQPEVSGFLNFGLLDEDRL
jgi:hypothetical protein